MQPERQLRQHLFHTCRIVSQHERVLVGEVLVDDGCGVLSRGATAIYHCANPPTYTEWERLLPPLQTAAIEPALTKGSAAWIPAHLDMPHTFTVNVDMAQALVTLARDERAWGRAWHVPSPPAVIHG